MEPKPKDTLVVSAQPNFRAHLGISNRWLRQIGVIPGDRVRVEVDHGKLIVTRYQEDGQP